MTPLLSLVYDGPWIIVFDGKFTEPKRFSGARTREGQAMLLRHVAEYLAPDQKFEPVPQARGWDKFKFKVRRWWWRRKR